MALIAKWLAKNFPYAVNWIQLKIVDQQSAIHANWLFKLHLNNLKDTDKIKLFQSIADYKAENNTTFGDACH